jgi:DNA-binding NtrC family response regulator
VLILGETGTGKSTLARMLHDQGPRADRPFIEVNCSALPDALIESELFGHQRGSFTDAKETRIGLFEAAAGGTLFLDEISAMPMSSQAKMLTAIERRVIRRVGSTQEIGVDVRVMAASLEDLETRAADQTFRADLYHRLDVLRLELPPSSPRRHCAVG